MFKDQHLFALHYFLSKIDHLGLFFFIILIQQFTVNKCSLKTSYAWIGTRYLRCQK